MRKQFLMFATAAMLVTVSASAQTQEVTTSTEYWVKTEPVAPHVTVTHPQRPSPNAVWIDEDWKYNTNTNAYEWSGGHWETPVTPGKKWKKGKWKKTSKGYSWQTGTWY